MRVKKMAELRRLLSFSRYPGDLILSHSGGFGCPGEGAVCQCDKMVRSHSALPRCPPPPAPNHGTEKQNLHQQAPLMVTFLHRSCPLFPPRHTLFSDLTVFFRALAFSPTTFFFPKMFVSVLSSVTFNSSHGVSRFSGTCWYNF